MKLRVRNSRHQEQVNFWPSFVDIMTAVALVFFFILLVGLAVVNIKDNALTAEMEKIKYTYDEIDHIAQDRMKLYENIESTLKKTPMKDSVRFNREKGTLEIASQTMFGFDSDNLTPQGVQLAEQVAHAFDALLSDKLNAKKIKRIEVMGHTDNIATGEYNRKLSTDRAVSFINKMLPKNSEMEKKYGKYFKASGMSKFEPVAGSVSVQTDEERSRNRRIEMYIVFNDEDISEAISNLIKNYKK